MKINGWGRVSFANMNSLKPESLNGLKTIIKNAEESSLIVYGKGKSYGDAAQLNNQTIIDLSNFNKVIFNKKKAIIEVEGGVTLEKILDKIIPHGYFLPVTPGIKEITIGGAIAADVHGKNHEVSGSIGNHVKKILLVEGNGKLIEIKPNDKKTKKLFWATVGGMGLTGVIVSATISLEKIENSYLKIKTKKFRELKKLINEMRKNTHEYPYKVAWIDYFDPNFRGILSYAKHSKNSEIKKIHKKNYLTFKKKSLLSIPAQLPNNIFNKNVIRIFNKIYFSKQKERYSSCHLNSYFYPLDIIKNWNYLFGSSGFIQYQFVIPFNKESFIFRTLETLKKESIPASLVVLKKFGKSNPSYLSFPKKGWTLAIDIPLGNSRVFKVLKDLDIYLMKSKGKLYLAKDSRQSSKTFQKTYKRLREWKVIKKRMDPQNIFSSDLAKRLNLS